MNIDECHIRLLVNTFHKVSPARASRKTLNLKVSTPKPKSRSLHRVFRLHKHFLTVVFAIVHKECVKLATQIPQRRLCISWLPAIGCPSAVSHSKTSDRQLFYHEFFSTKSLFHKFAILEQRLRRLPFKRKLQENHGEVQKNSALTNQGCFDLADA